MFSTPQSAKKTEADYYNKLLEKIDNYIKEERIFDYIAIVTRNYTPERKRRAIKAYFCENINKTLDHYLKAQHEHPGKWSFGDKKQALMHVLAESRKFYQKHDQPKNYFYQKIKNSQNLDPASIMKEMSEQFCPCKEEQAQYYERVVNQFIADYKIHHKPRMALEQVLKTLTRT